MNDIEYIIFDDNHRAIMENGVSFAQRATTNINDEVGKALICWWYRSFLARATILCSGGGGATAPVAIA